MMSLFLPCMFCPLWLVKNGHQPGEVGREEDFQSWSMGWQQQENLGSCLGGELGGLVRRAAERAGVLARPLLSVCAPRSVGLVEWTRCTDPSEMWKWLEALNA